VCAAVMKQGQIDIVSHTVTHFHALVLACLAHNLLHRHARSHTHTRVSLYVSAHKDGHKDSKTQTGGAMAGRTTRSDRK